MIVGVLALQGGFKEHMAMFEVLGCKAVAVRNALDLRQCQALVAPGGESTAIKKQLFPELIQWITSGKPYLGTCAGAILLADLRPDILTVTRNHYGAQQASFVENVQFPCFDFPGVFIRAPRLYKQQGEVVTTAGTEAVGILYEKQIALAFHPELTANTKVHDYSLEVWNQ